MIWEVCEPKLVPANVERIQSALPEAGITSTKGDGSVL